MRIKGLLACLLGALFALSCESSTLRSQPGRDARAPRKTLDRSASPFAVKVTGQPLLAQTGTPGFGDAGMGTGTMDDHMGMDHGSGMGTGGGGTNLGTGGGMGFGTGGGTGSSGLLDGGGLALDGGLELGFDGGGMTMR